MKNSTLASNLLAMKLPRSMSRIKAYAHASRYSSLRAFLPKRVFVNMLMVMFVLFFASPAFAQLKIPFLGGDKENEIPQPSQDAPPLPQSAIKKEQQQTIVPPAPAPIKVAEAPKMPQLPPAKPCIAAEVAGLLWKEIQVYEVPPGDETQALSENPEQYLLLRVNNTYAQLNAGHTAMSEADIRAAMDQNNTVLSQYLLQNTGMIYFYQNSAVVDTQVCFIVTNPKGEFHVGQMLLMPPEGQLPQRVVKVFDRVTGAHTNSGGRQWQRMGGQR